MNLCFKGPKSVSLAHLFWWLILAFALLRLWLVDSQAPYIIANAGHDDALFVKLAYNILHGKWLGAYDSLTTAKGAMFPIFLALNFFSGLPLLLSLQILYLAAGILLISLLEKQGINKFLLLILFVLYAFNPALVTLSARRILRDNFYTVLCAWLCVVTLGMLLAYFKQKRVWLWSLWVGFISGLMWITREEGLWLYPALGVLLLALFIFAPQKGLLARFKQLIPLALIVIVPLLVCAFIKLLNYYAYQVAILTEFQAAYYKDAYAQLTRIDNPNRRRYVNVSEAMRKQAYKVSPTFKKLKPYLENSPWVAPGCPYIKPCDDLSSHFSWALRDAAQRAGFYASAISAKQMYQQIAEEIYQGCEQKLIECGKARPHPFSFSDRTLFLKTFWRALSSVATFKNLDAQSASKGQATKDQLAYFAYLLNYQGLALSNKVRVRGWVVDPGQQALTVKLVDKAANLSGPEAHFRDSPDVDQFFKHEYPSAKKARFELNGRCRQNCAVHVYQAGQKALVFDLNKDKLVLNKANIHFHIDSSNYKPKPVRNLTAFKHRVLDWIAWCYEGFAPYLLVLSGLCWLGAFIFIWRPQVANLRPLFIFSTLCITLFFSRVALLAYVDMTFFQGINSIYLMPGYLVLLMAHICNILLGIRLLRFQKP